MDYCLDAGDGTASIWTGQQDVDLDADGLLDGVRLDIDGDGLFDDVLADLDGDGLAEAAALDLDGDGVPEARYTDDGSGDWAAGGGAANRPLRWFDLDGVEHTEAGADVDIDGDGVTDRLLDVDRDGLADRALRIDGALTIGYVDTDGDGRWDVTLVDTDGDGAADGAGDL
jgi:hypothetical protein